MIGSKHQSLHYNLLSNIPFHLHIILPVVTQRSSGSSHSAPIPVPVLASDPVPVSVPFLSNSMDSSSFVTSHQISMTSFPSSCSECSSIVHHYSTALHCTALYCTVLYCTVLYCTVLHCTVLYCIVLYCTAL